MHVIVLVKYTYQQMIILQVKIAHSAGAKQLYISQIHTPSLTNFPNSPHSLTLLFDM